MSMKQIILRLARNDGWPDGDPRQGYAIRAPLTDDGHIDLEAWRAAREDCTVQRMHYKAEERADGWLTHNGSHWRIRYDEDQEGPDEPIHRLVDHVFSTGEYVTVAHHGEEPLVYKVMSVEPV